MIFCQQTNSLIHDYLKLTGKPACSVSPDDYLKFRQCVLNEYMMGINQSDVLVKNNNDTIISLTEDTKPAKKSFSVEQKTDLSKSSDIGHENDIATNVVSMPDVREEKSQKKRMMEMMNAIKG